MLRLLVVPILSTSLLLAVPAAGQERGPAAPPPDPAAYWAALEHATTPAEVVVVEAPAGMEPRVADALRLLRQYELQPVRGTAYRARWELQREANRRPTDAWTQLALALVLRRGPDAHVRNSDPPTYYFVDPRSLASTHALRALRRALELEPGLELAALELGRFAVERFDRALLEEADAALARVPSSGDVLLQRAAIALKRRDGEGALGHATAAGRAHADAGIIAHTRAVALLLDPATERMGAAAYVDGLRAATPAALAEYYRVAAPVLRIEETTAWDTMRAERRASWLREMWELRAAQAGVSLAERLGVHFRRLYEAYDSYPLYAPLRAEDNVITGAVGVLIGEEMRRHGLSPQGLMLTRYGDPTWLRWLGVCGQDRIPYVFRPLENPFTVQTPGMLELDPVLPPGGRRPVDVFDMMRSEDYRRMQRVDCSNPTAIRHFAEYITSGDRYAPSFDVPLRVELEVYAFRGAAGTDIIAGLALPRSPLAGLVNAAGDVRIDAAIAFVDTVARRTDRSEHPLRFAPPDDDATHVLLTLPATTSLAGRVDMRVTVADSARRAGSVLSLLQDIPDFAAPGLLLSDLVIAPDEDAERAHRGDVALSIAAGRRYSAGETFRLYYEIYGLDVDAVYSTRIVLAPASSPLWRAVQQVTGRERDVVALQFEERASAPHVIYGLQQQRSITTSTLRPGVYTLRIEITDVGTGARVVRERRINIDG
jgi:hypothetical protein